MLDIVVVEREFAGFARSGAMAAGFRAASMVAEKYLKSSSREAVVGMQRAMAGTVDEVIRVTEAEGIDADIIRADNITVATNQPQLDRAREEYQFYLDWQMPAERIELLSAEDAAKRIRIANIKGAFVRDTARVQPAKLVRGLARVVEGLGVAIFGTSVTGLREGPRDDRPRHRARRHHPRDGRFHGPDPRRGAHLAAAQQRADRHRAASRRALGGDRLAGP